MDLKKKTYCSSLLDLQTKEIFQYALIPFFVNYVHKINGYLIKVKFSKNMFGTWAIQNEGYLINNENIKFKE